MTPPVRLRHNRHALAHGALAVVLVVTAATGITTASLGVVLCVAIAAGHAGTTLIDKPVSAPSGRDRAIIRTALPAASSLTVLGLSVVFAGAPSVGLLLGAAAAAIVGVGSAIADEPATIVAATRVRPSTARIVTTGLVAAVVVALAVALTTT